MSNSSHQILYVGLISSAHQTAAALGPQIDSSIGFSKTIGVFLIVVDTFGLFSYLALFLAFSYLLSCILDFFSSIFLNWKTFGTKSGWFGSADGRPDKF